MDRWPSSPRSSRRITSRIHSPACKSLRPGKLSDLSSVPLLLASRSRGRRDLECGRCQKSRLAWLSKLSCSLAFHRCTQVHPEIVMFLKSLQVHRGAPARPFRRGGVSKFFRCEAPFLHHHEIEWTIMPSLRAQKPWTPPRLQASLRLLRRTIARAFTHTQSRRQPAWLVASSGSPGSRGPLRRHS